MTRRIITLVLLAAISTAAQPRWYKSKRFWIGFAVVSGAALADGVSTEKCLRDHPDCAEHNPVFPERPSAVRLFGTGAVYSLGVSYVAYKLPNKFRWPLIIASSVTNTTFASLNLNSYHSSKRVKKVFP